MCPREPQQKNRVHEIHSQHELIPMVLRLDCGHSFELCKSCIDHGFSSMMSDGIDFITKT
jgi:fructose/tagatose bisphosphate aldolase